MSRVGLCADCRHSRRTGNRRGSTFYMCQLSAIDPRFPRYPRLPVVRCPGYDARAPDPDEGEAGNGTGIEASN